MAFLLLDALRDHLADALSGLPLLDPASRDRDIRVRAPRVLIGELPPRNKDEEGGYPFVLLRGASGDDLDDFSIVNVEIVCAVAAIERGEAVEHEIQNLLAWVRTALLKRRIIGPGELVPDDRGRLLTWSVYPEAAPPYVAGQVKGTWKLPGINLTEGSYA